MGMNQYFDFFWTADAAVQTEACGSEDEKLLNDFEGLVGCRPGEKRREHDKKKYVFIAACSLGGEQSRNLPSPGSRPPPHCSAHLHLGDGRVEGSPIFCLLLAVSSSCFSCENISCVFCPSLFFSICPSLSFSLFFSLSLFLSFSLSLSVCVCVCLCVCLCVFLRKCDTVPESSGWWIPPAPFASTCSTWKKCASFSFSLALSWQHEGCACAETKE